MSLLKVRMKSGHIKDLIDPVEVCTPMLKYYFSLASLHAVCMQLCILHNHFLLIIHLYYLGRLSIRR